MSEKRWQVLSILTSDICHYRFIDWRNPKERFVHLCKLNHRECTAENCSLRVTRTADEEAKRNENAHSVFKAAL